MDTDSFSNKKGRTHKKSLADHFNFDIDISSSDVTRLLMTLSDKDEVIYRII